MSNLYYSPEAHHDLDAMWEYICEELGNSVAAFNKVSDIQDSIGKLRTFPEMGSPLRSSVLIETDYRFLVCGSYLAFYRSGGEAVYIDRILYGQRNYLKSFLKKYRNNYENRVGGHPLIEWPTSRTTVLTVRYTAVQSHKCRDSYRSRML